MICLRCGHYRNADREMARVQRSDDCPCRCHDRDVDRNESTAGKTGS